MVIRPGGEGKVEEFLFANLSWPQMEAVLRSPRKTVLLFPVGATEPHGPHAPLATDVIISLGMCRRAARVLQDDPDLRALILPSLSYGVTRYSAGFPCPIHISEETLHAMIVDICVALIAQRFQHIMLVNNHFEPEHVRTIHRSLDTVHDRTGIVVGYLDLTRRSRAQALPEEFWKFGSHAGRYETSLVLADWPTLVDTDVARSLPEVPVNLAKVISAGMKEFAAMGLSQAYNGAPSGATAEEGESLFARLTEMLVAQIRDLVAGTGGRDGPGFYTRV